MTSGSMRPLRRAAPRAELSSEHHQISEILGATGRRFVHHEVAPADDRHRPLREGDADATLPGTGERDPIDPREDIDAIRLPPQHEDLAGRREDLDLRHYASES